MITKPEGYDDAQAITGEFETLPPGGYVCRIKGAKEEISSTKKPMLVLALDISEGEYKDFFAKSFQNDTRENKKWGCVYRQMLTNESAGFLKSLVSDIEKSNGFQWDFDEKKLIGKYIGMLFQREEYEKRNGGTAFFTKPFQPRTVDKIRSGDFTTPEDKLIEKTSYNDYADLDPIDEENMPF